MRYVIGLFLIAVLTGCSEKPKPPLVTQTTNFVFVTASSKENRDIEILNTWVKENPGKRITSFAGSPAHRGDVYGYILFFKDGDNTNQRFATIKKPFSDTKGLKDLEGFAAKYTIVAIATVPSQSDIQSWTVCYEDK